MEAKKKPRIRAGQNYQTKLLSGTESGRFNQADLISPCGELTALVTLNDHAATRLDTDDPSSNPAKSG